MTQTAYNKDSLITRVKEFSDAFQIDLGDIVVGGGGAMVLRDLWDTTDDLNLWIPEEHWKRLFESYGYASENRRDPVVVVDGVVWLRKFNPYFRTEVIDELRTYTLIELIIHYRGSYSRCERPQPKRNCDFDAIKALEELHRGAHAVKKDPEPVNEPVVEVNLDLAGDNWEPTVN